MKRVWIATALLFVLGAFPLFLCDVPPLQDLPAHLATSVVIRHPDAYPNFVFHGFFKTNGALFLWLHVFGEARLVLAAKLFVALVIFAHAWVFPRLAVEIGGEDKLVPATLLAVPLVHNWFVAMGMLDYALGSALALATVLLLVRQMHEPTRARAVAIGALGLAIWYAHVFALAIVVVLVVIEAARSKSVRAFAMAAPLGPAIALAAWSVILELGRAHAPATHGLVWRTPWETIYELWAKYPWSFSKLEIASLATPVVLAIGFSRDRRLDAPFLSPLAGVVLLVCFFAVPSEAFDWFAVNSRVLPFVYAIALVRVTELPRLVKIGLGACAVASSVGLALDYRRLDRDERELAAATSIVPESADLMPLVFAPKGSSENTWALLHGWGAYVVAKHTSAPLLFAHSPSFPIGYRVAPSDDQHPLRIAREVEERDAAELSRVASRHAWVLVWGPAPDGFSVPGHSVAFDRGRLRIYAP